MARSQSQDKPGIDLIDETALMLRHLGLGSLLTYYVGALPFCLAFLYYWTAMSTSVSAIRLAVPGAFVLTVLYFWMKCWQTRFCALVWRELSPDRTVDWDRQTWLLTLSRHVRYQPWGLVIVPIALSLAIPFGWAFAFYQNLTVSAHFDRQEGQQSYVGRAWEQAFHLWRQNHAVLSTLLLMMMVVFFNWLFIGFFLPDFLDRFLGWETVFSRSGMHIFNSTFIAIAMVLTFLLVDPVVKVAYTVRFFYGLSQRTGADLRADLALLKRAGAALILFAMVGFGPHLQAQQQADGQQDEVLLLEQSIDRTIQQPRYQWRLSRDQDAELEQGFFEQIGAAIRSIMNQVRKLMEGIVDMMVATGGNTMDESQPQERDQGRSLWFLLLIVLAAMAIGFGLVRFWLRRSKRVDSQNEAQKPRQQAVNLDDHDLHAQDLPEDRWLSLAGEMLKDQKPKLAMRAYFLAMLANMGEQGWIELQRGKTNQDYLREYLRRRAKHVDAALFQQTITEFEQVWFGNYQSSLEDAHALRQKRERILQNAH